MNTIIAVVGAPGVGKTTFCEKLNILSDIFHFNSDKFCAMHRRSEEKSLPQSERVEIYLNSKKKAIASALENEKVILVDAVAATQSKRKYLRFDDAQIIFIHIVAVGAEVEAAIKTESHPLNNPSERLAAHKKTLQIWEDFDSTDQVIQIDRSYSIESVYQVIQSYL